MNTAEIIREIHQYHGTITASDGYLNLRAPSPLPDALMALIKACKSDLLVVLSEGTPELTPDDLTDIQEAIDERAAIQEYEGGLSREKAKHDAQAAMCVYRYRLTDNPDNWLTMIAPGCNLKEAERVLITNFGDRRVVDVKKSLFSMK